MALKHQSCSISLAQRKLKIKSTLYYSFFLPIKVQTFFRILWENSSSSMTSSTLISQDSQTYTPPVYTPLIMSELCIYWVTGRLHHLDVPASLQQCEVNSLPPILSFFLFFLFQLMVSLAIQPPKSEPFFPFLHLSPVVISQVPFITDLFLHPHSYCLIQALMSELGLWQQSWLISLPPVFTLPLQIFFA